MGWMQLLDQQKLYNEMECLMVLYNHDVNVPVFSA